MQIPHRFLGMIIVVCAMSGATVAYAQDAAAPGTVSKSQIRQANNALAHRVRGALGRQKIDTSDVRVLAHSGAIFLEGTTQDQDQIERAGAVAQKVSGVTSVRNDLTLKVSGR